MNHESPKQILIRIPESACSELIKLLDKHIRSEIARARAFRCRGDESNAYSADRKQEYFLNLRNSFVEGCQEVDDV